MPLFFIFSNFEINIKRRWVFSYSAIVHKPSYRAFCSVSAPKLAYFLSTQSDVKLGHMTNSKMIFEFFCTKKNLYKRHFFCGCNICICASCMRALRNNVTIAQMFNCDYWGSFTRPISLSWCVSQNRITFLFIKMG